MIDTIQIIDILNGLKNWVIKWSGHSEKGTFTTEVAGNTKLSSNSKKITPKYESVEVVQLYKTSRKMAKCYWLVRYFQVFDNF